MPTGYNPNRINELTNEQLEEFHDIALNTVAGLAAAYNIFKKMSIDISHAVPIMANIESAIDGRKYHNLTVDTSMVDEDVMAIIKKYGSNMADLEDDLYNSLLDQVMTANDMWREWDIILSDIVQELKARGLE